MKKILFQGDSITDQGRGDNGLGHGYVNLIASDLGFKFPGEYEFVNRGTSRNCVADLLARWKFDCINLKPDFVSIMIGINDVWNELEDKNCVFVGRYEVLYNMLISDIKTTLPDTKIILMAPFVTPGPATDEKIDCFRNGVEKCSEAVFRIADKYCLPVINLQKEFDKCCECMDASLWTIDGVHPTNAGHELIKRVWIKEFLKLENRGSEGNYEK